MAEQRRRGHDRGEERWDDRGEERGDGRGEERAMSEERREGMTKERREGWRRRSRGHIPPRACRMDRQRLGAVDVGEVLERDAARGGEFGAAVE